MELQLTLDEPAEAKIHTEEFYSQPLLCSHMKGGDPHWALLFSQFNYFRGYREGTPHLVR